MEFNAPFTPTIAAPKHFKDVTEVVNVISEFLPTTRGRLQFSGDGRFITSDRMSAASVNKKWRTAILWEGHEADFKKHRKLAEKDREGRAIWDGLQQDRTTTTATANYAPGARNAWIATCAVYWTLLGIFLIACGFVTTAEPRGWLFIGFSAFIMPIFLMIFPCMTCCCCKSGRPRRDPSEPAPRIYFFIMCLLIWINFLAFWGISYGADVNALIKDTNGLRVIVAERDLSYTNSSTGKLSCAASVTSNDPHALVRFEDLDGWRFGVWKGIGPKIAFSGHAAVYTANAGYPKTPHPLIALFRYTPDWYFFNAISPWKKVQSYMEDIKRSLSSELTKLYDATSPCVTPMIQFEKSVDTADPEWRRRIKSGEPLYCSFYFPGATLGNPELVHDYRTRYTGIVLCRNLLNSTTNASSASIILGLSSLVLLLTFAACCFILGRMIRHKRVYKTYLSKVGALDESRQKLKQRALLPQRHCADPFV